MLLLDRFLSFGRVLLFRCTLRFNGIAFYLSGRKSKAMGNQENHPSGFIRFKAAGDSSGNRQARDVYPEHVREAIYARTEGLNKSKPAQPKTTTSAEHAANAVSIQAQIEAIRKQRERLEAKKKSSSFKSTSALPPAPPAYTSSTANKYCKKR